MKYNNILNENIKEVNIYLIIIKSIFNIKFY